MSILAWIIFGGLAGWIASKIAKTDESMGVGLNIIVGIAGAFVGGFLFSLFGGTTIMQFNISSFLIAVLGAVLLLWIFKAATGKK